MLSASWPKYSYGYSREIQKSTQSTTSYNNFLLLKFMYFRENTNNYIFSLIIDEDKANLS